MNYVIYARKSTEDKGRQILSLESQVSTMRKMADDLGLKIIRVFIESKSAKKPDNRPVFSEMIKMFEQGKAEGIVCWKLDRLSRNPVDSGKIQWLSQQGIIKDIQTSEKRYLPDDNAVVYTVESGMANQYIRDLSKNVKRGNRTKLEKGGWLGKAPLGYLNNKLDRSIFIDKRKSKYIVRAFELCACGNHSLKEIMNILYDEGFRSENGLMVRKATIHRMISNPTYYGVMKRNEKLYKGNHKPIISKNLFDRAQSALQIRTHTKKQKLFFTYRGFLKCNCGCVYTASKKKGHDYYYCTNGKGSCNVHNKYERAENIDDLILEIFDKIQFDEEFIDIAYQASKEKYVNNKGYVDNSKSNLESELKIVDQRKNKLLDTYLSDLIDKNVYEAKMKELENNRVELENQIQNLKVENGYDETTLEQIKNVFLLANKAKETFRGYDKYKKRELLEILLWNLDIENKKIADVRFKMPYQLLANTPKKCDFTTMFGDRDSNPDWLLQRQPSYH